MNTGLLAIDNMFAGAAGRGPAPSRPAATKNTEQFSLMSADNPPSANTPEKTKTDNTLTNPQSEPTNKPPQDFTHSLREKTTTEEPRKAQDSDKSREQCPTSDVAEHPNNVVQGRLAQHSVDGDHSKEGVATRVEAKAGRELAQLLVNLKTGKSPPVTGQAAKSDEIKLLMPTNKCQLGLKTIVPNISKQPLATDTKYGEWKNADEIPTLNKTIAGTKDLTVQEGGQKLMAKVPAVSSKITAPDRKSAIADTSATSGSQKTYTSSSKELTPEVLVDGGSKTTAASEKPIMADKPAVPGGQKTSALNTTFLEAQDKSSGPGRRALVGPEKSATVAQKPTDNKAADGQTLLESSGGNGKQQTDDSSGNSPLWKLNITEVQISTGQTKDRSSSTSNNSSNSNFEQMLSHNNAQIPVSEQSSAPAEAGKITNIPSPSDASASISEQILESIHSSLRQGDQQITIRLNPPELGKVFIKFQQQQDQIIGLLEVSKTQTRYEIEQALPQIIRNLADCGIQLKRLEVILTADQAEQQAYKDQSLQDGSLQQHGFAEGGNPDNNSANEWLTNDSSYQDNPELQIQITDNSINMLI